MLYYTLFLNQSFLYAKLRFYKAFEQVKQKENPINNLSFINMQPETSIFLSFFGIKDIRTGSETTINEQLTDFAVKYLP